MSFAAAAERIKSRFETMSGHVIFLVTGSTGKMASQAALGAPFDVLLAADQARPRRLIKDGHAVAGSQFTYAVGKLVLWSADGDRLGGAQRPLADILGSSDYRRLAIANPKLAPYGAAAREVMETLGLSQKLKDKLIYGENIQQAYAYAASGNAEMALVALSFMLSARIPDKGAYRQIPAQLHQPIRQDAVLLSYGADNEAAKGFLVFLQSSEAARMMRDWGFEPGGQAAQ